MLRYIFLSSLLFSHVMHGAARKLQRKKTPPIDIVVTPPDRSLCDSDEWEKLSSSPVASRFKEKLHKQVERQREKSGGQRLNLAQRRRVRIEQADICFMLDRLVERFSFSKETERAWRRNPSLRSGIYYYKAKGEDVQDLQHYIKSASTMKFLLYRFNLRDMQQRMCDYADALDDTVVCAKYKELVLDRLMVEFTYEVFENLDAIEKHW